LKIQNIATQKLKIPLKTPFVTALRRVEDVEFVRVCITFDDGSAAFGEAPATKAITGEDLDDILNAVQRVKSLLIGLNAADALEMLHHQYIGSSAKAAVDMALFFAVNELKFEDDTAMKSDITISLNAVHEMLEDAKAAYADGYEILKVKLGSDIKHAIEVTFAISQALPNAVILIDANQAWSVSASLEYLNAVDTLEIALVEQPVKADDLEGLKRIKEATTIPILADEAAFNLEDVKKIFENKAADMINIKLMKCGGVSKAIEILEYAREKKIPCMLGSMLEGPLSINAAYKLAFAYRDVIKYIDLDSPMLYADVPSIVGDFAIKRNQIKPNTPASKEAVSMPIFA
jgi:L-alanine-DL-glutamate epimerase-like enolase superfamily enzyme